MTQQSLAQSDIGGFVQANNDLGIGRLSDLQNATARVRYFRGPSRNPYEEREVASEELQRVSLSRHTRVFLHDGRRWKIGRIDAERPDFDRNYVVAFPNREGEVLSEADFDVRWAPRVENPFEILAVLGGDSPLVYEPRAALISEWHRQRAAASGVEGLLLASVELHNHQLKIVRHVADDTARRYLLADEVGLGKTIEASALIWQHLRQNPDGKVLVLAPDHLRQQWEEELLGKFHTANFSRASIKIEAHCDTESWPSEAVDLLVVDEAHHLTRAGSHPPETLERLIDAAHAAAEVLLISATPVRSNETAFLDLLHLLNPDDYKLDDLPAFKRRVELRDQLALTYLALTPELGAFEVSLYAEQLSSMFPQDAVLRSLTEQAQESSDEERPEGIARVREHLSETYRLHHRLLRTRRTPEIIDSFGVRGRCRGLPFTLDVADETDHIRFDLLEDFRQHLARLVEEGYLELRDAALALRSMAECCGSLPHALLSLADSSVRDDGYQTIPLDSIASQWLGNAGNTWRRDIEAYASVILERLVREIGTRTISKNQGKVVIATTFTAVAEVVAKTLTSKFGAHRISTHLQNNERSTNSGEVARWKEELSCRVLVCDASAEEGLNLQPAELIIHLDLPWEAFRLEQRIGRADRYVERSANPVRSIVVTYGDQSYALDWFAFVADACSLFDRSGSSLQYVLSDIEVAILERAVFEGSSVLENEIEAHRATISDEIRRIAAHDSLDTVGSRHQPLNEMLVESDEDPTLRKAFSTWMTGVGIKMETPRKNTIKIAQRPRPQVPFRLEVAMAPWVGTEIATTRKSAVKNTLPILRAGHGLLDAIVDHLAADDRGVAFSFLRPSPGQWPPIPVLRTDYLIQAGPNEPIMRVARAHGVAGWLKRAIDSTLPPVPETVFASDAGKEVEHAGVTRWYNPTKGDRNLISHPELFVALTSHLNWDGICSHGLDTTNKIVSGRPSVALVPKKGGTDVANSLTSQITRWRARRNVGLNVETAELTALERLADSMPEQLEVTLKVLGCGMILFADPNMIGS